MAVGEKISDYAPDVLPYTSRIGKIAKQVIDNETIPSKFNPLLKDIGEYGKDIEVTLYKKVVGAATTRTGVVTFDPPAGVTLLFKQWIEKTYPVRLDKTQIRQSSTDAETAERNADAIIETLYAGAEADKYLNAMGAFSTLTVGDPVNTGATQIVDGGGYSEIDSFDTAAEYLKTVKNAAKEIRDGSPSANPYGYEVPARTVVMIAPYKTITAVDTCVRLEAKNEDKYGRFDVDILIEYDPAKLPPDVSAATYVFDDRFAQFFERNQEYEETKAKGNKGIDACLYTENMYGICPLFSAKKFTEN